MVEVASTSAGATLAESGSVTVNVAVTNGEDFAAVTSEDVVLDVEITAAGDPEVVSARRNDPMSANDYTVGELVIDHETGRGSFTFTAEDDGIPEGREIITLALADPDGNLPDGWTVSDAASRFTVTVPANDNAVRFAGLPADDAGGLPELSATVEEGETEGLPRLNILIDHIAPDGGLPLLVSVPDEYGGDIGLENIDNRKSIWDSANGRFVFLREGDIDREPNLVASLQILIKDDDEPEPEESFDITLGEFPGFPSGWGGVANAPDTRVPPVAVSTTFSVTIPASDNTATFATTNPVSVAGSVDTMDLTINLTNAAPAGGLPLMLAASGDTDAVSFDETNPRAAAHAFSVAAGASSGQVTVYIRPDDNADPGSVTFTLTPGSDFPTGWGGVPDGETLTLEVTED